MEVAPEWTTSPLAPRLEREAQELVVQALGRDPATRTCFIAEACGERRELSQQVCRVLRAIEQAGDFLGAPACALVTGPDGVSYSETSESMALPEKIGSYRIVDWIGDGGYGQVYLAEHEGSGLRVALKLLRPSVTTPASLQRFRNEAELLGRIDQPGVAQICDSGTAATLEGPRHYLATRYIDGQSLSQCLTLRQGPRDRLSIIDAIQIVEGVARALHVAHDLGIVHRDVKPGNIMLRQDGQPVLIDFGIARYRREGGLTASRSSLLGVGTPAYMAPEQIDGQQRVGRQADVWALGVTLFECLCSKTPFGRESVLQTFEAIRKAPTPDPRPYRANLPKDVVAVLEMALEKDPRRRYATAKDLADDLRAVLEKRTPRARKVGMLGRAFRWAEREPIKAGLSLAVLLALPIITFLLAEYVHSRSAVVKDRERRLQAATDRILAEANHELGEGDERRALSLYRQVLSDNPTSVEAVVGLAFVYMTMDRAKMALQTLDEYEGLLQGLAAGKIIRDDILFSLGELKELREPEVEMTGPVDHYLMAMRFMQKGHEGQEGYFEKAQREFRKAALLSSTPHRLTYIAGWLHAAGHTQDAPEVCDLGRLVAQQWPNHPLALLRYGTALVQCNQIDAAIANFARALQVNPELADAHYNLGDAYVRKGQAPEAIASFAEAIRINPEFGLAHSHLGLAHKINGDLDAAIESYREALRITPGRAPVYNNLGNALKLRGDLLAAEAAYGKAIELDPQLARAHANLANLLSRKGEHERAEQSYREALRIEPENAWVHYCLGALLQKLGNARRAIECYEEAIRIDPDLAEAHCNLGLMLAEIRKIPECVEALARGHELGSKRENWPYPSEYWLQQARAELERRRKSQ